MSSPRVPTALRALRLPALAFLCFLSGCATLRGLAALSQVRFAAEGVSDVRLAGISVDRIRAFEDLSAAEVFRITSALTGGTVPLSFDVDLTAANPAGNPEARLVELAWTLVLQGEETVSGNLARGLHFPPGEVTSFPVEVSLDARDFFEGGARDLVDLALGIAGVGTEPVDVRLEAVPTLDTALGPIRYPEPLVLVARQGAAGRRD